MSVNVELARTVMLQQQLRAGSVLDPRVLDALATVPREQFVPPAYQGVAFADDPIPLARGQWMMTPLQEGLLLQALDIRPTDHIVEIGTGSGYLTACLAHLGAEVTSVELFPELADAARGRLEAHHVVNCKVVLGDIFDVDPLHADVIAVTGSLPVADTPFPNWLKAGGRLFQVTGRSLPMLAWRIERSADNEFRCDRLFETSVPALIHAPAAEGFAF